MWPRFDQKTPTRSLLNHWYNQNRSRHQGLSLAHPTAAKPSQHPSDLPTLVFSASAPSSRGRTARFQCVSKSGSCVARVLHLHQRSPTRLFVLQINSGAVVDEQLSYRDEPVAQDGAQKSYTQSRLWTCARALRRARDVHEQLLKLYILQRRSYPRIAANMSGVAPSSSSFMSTLTLSISMRYFTRL